MAAHDLRPGDGEGMTAMEASAGPAAPTSRASGSAQGTVRRLIVYTILFALVTIAAIGVAGLLERLLGFGSPFVFGGTADLARSLAFALIGGPLAAVLWWAVWRRLRDESERASLAWGLYVAAMCAVSLIVATSALVGTATALVDGRWQPGTFATGVVWALVWVWHRWMWRHPVNRPVRLRTVPAVIGTVFGLIIGVGGAVYALGALFDTAIRGALEPAIAGGPWWHGAGRGAIWAVAGAAIWWWHWYREGARRPAHALRRGRARGRRRGWRGRADARWARHRAVGRAPPRLRSGRVGRRGPPPAGNGARVGARRRSRLDLPPPRRHSSGLHSPAEHAGHVGRRPRRRRLGHRRRRERGARGVRQPARGVGLPFAAARRHQRARRRRTRLVAELEDLSRGRRGRDRRTPADGCTSSPSSG